MTTVSLFCKKNGVLRSCVAEGHAGYSIKGTDIVCAAVTILLRTIMLTLDRTTGIRLDADTAERGRLAFSVMVCDDSCTDRLICAGDFLRCGLQSLTEEFPGNVELRDYREE
jgi:hypothetical protein